MTCTRSTSTICSPSSTSPATLARDGPVELEKPIGIVVKGAIADYSHDDVPSHSEAILRLPYKNFMAGKMDNATIIRRAKKKVNRASNRATAEDGLDDDDDADEKDDTASTNPTEDDGGSEADSNDHQTTASTEEEHPAASASGDPPATPFPRRRALRSGPATPQASEDSTVTGDDGIPVVPRTTPAAPGLSTWDMLTLRNNIMHNATKALANKPELDPKKKITP
ncbi:hypothetical protein LTR10_023640 [Elasticomyces elasticus]|uniref:Uncharacterized protein n=1 Tax=Exophiala sideris TaxID=1016849 RepID=A0ABR0IUD8_9EURO|nr:hypothetical protein LTR10_023640 [Elasticomyces elasticus]KAK5020943.1 hypothetical protein LTS07_011352 [Exophiala sideris]KAK5048438.1 hypothetical protein LTR69_011377 [Exophiala sideris]